jgi:uncharacterized protein
MHTDAEIDHLEELLSNIEVMPDAMCASELDGFIAGLLLCPEMIVPSEWLPEVWAMDDQPEFESIEQARETIGAVMAHYNRVAENLAGRTNPYGIVLEHAEGQDRPFWEFWIAGFYQAMRLRPEAWEAYWSADDDTTIGAITMMCALIDVEASESTLPEDKQAALSDEASEIIPSLVVTMNDWLKSRPLARIRTGGATDWFGAANMNTRPARSTKVGRNEPCPCGSGRKYKQCCAK